MNIRKCERKAYSVSGAPVATLGIVDFEFKINGASYTHEFLILRGLIHPAILGLDFLSKFNANIQLGENPRLQLRHPVNKLVSVDFIKRARGGKIPTRIAIVGDIEIPPLTTYYADAYISNIEGVAGIEDTSKERLFGITSIQHEDPLFDPGIIMRDAVIDPKSAQFKVELMNPSSFKLKVAADTPVGFIFDENCEILENEV